MPPRVRPSVADVLRQFDRARSTVELARTMDWSAEHTRSLVHYLLRKRRLVRHDRGVYGPPGSDPRTLPPLQQPLEERIHVFCLGTYRTLPSIVSDLCTTNYRALMAIDALKRQGRILVVHSPKAKTVYTGIDAESTAQKTGVGPDRTCKPSRAPTKATGPAAERLAQTLTRPLTIQELSEALGISRAMTSSRLKAMIEAGRVVKIRRGLYERVDKVQNPS